MTQLDVEIHAWNAHATGCRHAVGSADTHRALCDSAQRIWNRIITEAGKLAAATR